MAEKRTYYQWRPHPWHGLDVGPNPPEIVQAYIEITPFDMAKYEIDKATGYLRVNRLQKTSSSPPSLYGFIPRTYCGKRVAALAPAARFGDGDPLDICVISERQITHTEILINARVIGGFQSIDKDEADDKIIAVLEGDDVWGSLRDISELPEALTGRLRHYFLTYKLVPGTENAVKIEKSYGREHAHQVVLAAMQDYLEDYG